MSRTLCMLVHQSQWLAISMGGLTAPLRRLFLISDWFQSQFYDIIEIFRIGGYAPNTNYLFLGMMGKSVFDKTLLIFSKGTMWIAVSSQSKRFPF